MGREGDTEVDRWQIFLGKDPDDMYAGGVDPPDGFDAIGPWFPFAAEDALIWWRRPLKKRRG